MITDKLLRLSDAQAITTTANSTNVIDLSAARDIGEGDDLYVVINVNTALAGGTSLATSVVVADDTGLSSNVVTLGMTGTVLTANLGAGAQFIMRISPQIAALGHRYLGLIFTVSGTYTSGAVTADIVSDIQDGKKFYPSGFSVV